MAPTFQAGQRCRHFTAGWTDSQNGRKYAAHEQTDWHDSLPRKGTRPIKKGAMNALFWILNANAWDLSRATAGRPSGHTSQTSHLLARAQAAWRPLPRGRQRSQSARVELVCQTSRAHGHGRPGHIRGRAEVIPACEEELAERTVAVSIETGQAHLAVCCIYAQVDPTPFQVERQLELLSRWIWQQTQDWMICGDFNFEPHELSNGLPRKASTPKK
eukprot:6138119-Amphidinium_carterae.1